MLYSALLSSYSKFFVKGLKAGCSIGSMVSGAMGDSKKPNRRELARRRKIRKFWADHPERCKAQSQTQKQIWTPERCKAKSKEMTQFFSDPDHP